MKQLKTMLGVTAILTLLVGWAFIVHQLHKYAQVVGGWGRGVGQNPNDGLIPFVLIWFAPILIGIISGLLTFAAAKRKGAHQPQIPFLG